MAACFIVNAYICYVIADTEVPLKIMWNFVLLQIDKERNVLYVEFASVEKYIRLGY